MMRVRQIALTAAVAFIAGVAGVVIGNELGSGATAERVATVRAIIHGSLDLTPSQQETLDRIEARYAVRRSELEAAMRASNAALAEAMREDQAYSPRVRAAIEDFHVAMSALQAATIRHVFELRAELTPEQAEIFDAEIVRALADASE